MPKLVMPGFVPGIHAWSAIADGKKTWMAGTSPAVTNCAILRVDQTGLSVRISNSCDDMRSQLPRRDAPR